MKVIKNTYPGHPNAPRAEIGNEVSWRHAQSFELIRDVDGKIVFATAPVTRDGLLRSNGKSPMLIGVIAQVKSKGWILEIA